MGLFGKKNVEITSNIVLGDSVIERNSYTIEGSDAVVVVDENVEAIVLVDGKMQCLLKAGKHTIELPSGSKSMKLDICFVNRTVHMSSPWGTPSRIEYIDSLTNVPVSFGASGTVVLGVSNSLKLFERCLGTSQGATVQSVVQFLRPMISQEVKTRLAQKVISEGANFYELAASTKDMSQLIMVELQSVFADYGVTIEHFVIENLAYSDDIKQLVRQRAIKQYLADEKEVVTTESSDNRFCTSCGAPATVDSKFCAMCGHAL